MQRHKKLQVIKPGVLTTVQDLGRIGYQQYGVPVSGAMDTYALQMANILVGNPRAEAGLEVTLIGPMLEAKSRSTIAITGANLSPTINGKAIPMWKSIHIKEGDQLAFGKRKSGMRAYIAVAGGMYAPVSFNSKSTDRNSQFGLELEKDMSLYGTEAHTSSGVSIDKAMIPTYENEVEISVIEGPHTELFSNEERRNFFQSTYTVDSNSNRMGYRLKSEKTILPNLNRQGIWSDPVPFGGIQIPGNGHPIILMADRQTTGGYPRIGTVMSSDLSKIAQLTPTNKIRFQPITVEEAQSKAKQLESILHKLETFHRK